LIYLNRLSMKGNKMNLKMRLPRTYSPGERKFWAIKEVLEKNDRTLEEEYHLIQEKKSTLSKSQRDYVELMVAFKQEFNNNNEE